MRTRRINDETLTIADDNHIITQTQLFSSKLNDHFLTLTQSRRSSDQRARPHPRVHTARQGQRTRLQRRVPPPVCHVDVHLARDEQPKRLELPLCSGEVEGGAPVVVSTLEGGCLARGGEVLQVQKVAGRRRLARLSYGGEAA